MSHSELPELISKLTQDLHVSVQTASSLFTKDGIKTARSLRDTYALNALPRRTQLEIEGFPEAINEQFKSLNITHIRENIDTAFKQLDIETNTQWYFRQLLNLKGHSSEVTQIINQEVEDSQNRIASIVKNAQSEHDILGKDTISPIIEAERLAIANELDFKKNPNPVINKNFTLLANILNAKGDISTRHVNASAQHLRHLNATLRLYIIMLLQPETLPEKDDRIALQRLMSKHAGLTALSISFAKDTLPQSNISSALSNIAANAPTPLQIH